MPLSSLYPDVQRGIAGTGGPSVPAAGSRARTGGFGAASGAARRPTQPTFGSLGTLSSLPDVSQFSGGIGNWSDQAVAYAAQHPNQNAYGLADWGRAFDVSRYRVLPNTGYPSGVTAHGLLPGGAGQLHGATLGSGAGTQYASQGINPSGEQVVSARTVFQPPTAGSYVQLRAPTGELQQVPADTVEYYMSRGASRV